MLVSEALRKIYHNGVKYHEMFKAFNFASEAEFHKNKEAILFCVHVVDEFATLGQGISINLLEKMFMIGDEIQALTEHQKTLVSKYMTYNTYKLYDFMILDLPTILKRLKMWFPQ